MIEQRSSTAPSPPNSLGLSCMSSSLRSRTVQRALAIRCLLALPSHGSLVVGTSRLGLQKKALHFIHHAPETHVKNRQITYALLARIWRVCFSISRAVITPRLSRPKHSTLNLAAEQAHAPCCAQCRCTPTSVPQRRELVGTQQRLEPCRSPTNIAQPQRLHAR